MTQINKKALLHLADLVRIELDEKESEKLLKDLTKILKYFQELQKLDTQNVEPLSGGIDIKNAFRDDELANRLEADSVYDAFPQKDNRHLKTPPVFE